MMRAMSSWSSRANTFIVVEFVSVLAHAAADQRGDVIEDRPARNKGTELVDASWL
jgi:hypothetical protein